MRSYSIRRSAVAVALAAGLAATGLTVAQDAGAGSTATAQSITVPCPASAQVTPALDTNLISNPGAEDTTPFPAGYGLPANESYLSEPDCWTISSPSSVPGGIPGAFAYDSSSAANPPTADPDKGSNLFVGGIDVGPTIHSQIVTHARQTIDLSSLDAGGKRFLLSAYLGDYGSEANYDVVSVSFRGSSGQVLGPGAHVGPVTPVGRCHANALIPETTTGVVPGGATQAVVTIASYKVFPETTIVNADGIADSLNLTIGSGASVTAPAPAAGLTCVDYAQAGPGGGLSQPLGVSAWHGRVYVSNTSDNIVSAVRGDTTTTVAGSLQAFGEHGDGGPASRATLSQPAGTAEDARGDIYIADLGDNVIREVNARTGVITRFAGTGVPGTSGLGGPATSAELDAPQGVAVDARGDVFIADTDNNRVLEVRPDGVIVPFAGDGTSGYAGDGGAATEAELNRPTAVAVDALGNVYIADSANQVVRRVDAATGIITTVAGDHAAAEADGGFGGFGGDGGPATSAELNTPTGVAVDGAGDLFITDTWNNAIREVTPDGIISTVVNGPKPVAGTPSPLGVAPATARLHLPSAIAIDPSTDTLYIADTISGLVEAVVGLARPGDAAGPVAPAQ